MEAKNYQRNKREEFFGAKWPFFFIACQLWKHFSQLSRPLRKLATHLPVHLQF